MEKDILTGGNVAGSTVALLEQVRPQINIAVAGSNEQGLI